MPKGQVVEETDYKFEEGWYSARLESVIERTNEFTYQAHHQAVKRGDKKVGEKGSVTSWRWNFKLLDDPYAGDEARGETDSRISTRSDNKARLWYEVLIGHELEVGEGVDTDLVEGQVCQVHIGHQDPVTKKDGTKGFYCEVTDLAPAGDRAIAASGAYPDEPPF